MGCSAKKLTLGKLSGRNAFRTRLKELGIEPATEEALNAAFARFKELADKKSEIFDEDLLALVGDGQSTEEAETYKLISLSTHTETGEQPVAEIVFSAHGEEKRSSSNGSGPVDATFKAIEVLVKSEAELQLYSVNAITSGTDSQGEVTVRLSKAGRVVNGQGADTDIIAASAKAYFSALNRLTHNQARAHPQV